MDHYLVGMSVIQKVEPLVVAKVAVKAVGMVGAMDMSWVGKKVY